MKVRKKKKKPIQEKEKENKKWSKVVAGTVCGSLMCV